jgi:hypothetical protein
MGTRLLPLSDKNNNSFFRMPCRTRTEIMINQTTDLTKITCTLNPPSLPPFSVKSSSFSQPLEDRFSIHQTPLCVLLNMATLIKSILSVHHYLSLCYIGMG